MTALTVMVTLLQLEFALCPDQTRHGRCRQLSSTLSSTGSTTTTGNVTQETLAYMLMDYSIYLIFTHKCICVHRDLARNEEFSEIAVINIFFTVLKKNHSYLWGGVLRGKFRDKSRN